MEKFDKILELLEKKSLTEAEKKLLEEFSDSDDEIKSFISFYDSLRSSLTVTGHIPTDLLTSYVMFEMGDASEDNIIPVLREKIKSHLDQCKEGRARKGRPGGWEREKPEKHDNRLK